MRSRWTRACVPAGRAPVRPYWRMLERGADATEPLVESELRAFGVERQNIDAGRIDIVLRGMPARAITIRTWRGPDGTCMSSANMTIAGVARSCDERLRAPEALRRRLRAAHGLDLERRARARAPLALSCPRRGLVEARGVSRAGARTPRRRTPPGPSRRRRRSAASRAFHPPRARRSASASLIVSVGP